MRKIAIRTLASVAGLLLLGLVLILVIDFGIFQTRIEKIASESLGREISFDDGLHIHLFPKPKVRAAGVRVSNPDWAAADDFIHADKLYLEFDFWSAVSPPFQIVNLNIEGLSLDIQTQEDGSGNWPTGSASSPEDETGSGELRDSLLLGNVAISDLRMTYRDSALPEETMDVVGDLNVQQVTAGKIKGDFAAAVDGPALAGQLAVLGGGSLKVQSNFTLHLQKDELDLELDALELVVGASDLSGKMAFSVAGNIVVAAELSSETIALVESNSEEDAAPAEGLVFSENADLFDAVRDFPAEISLDLHVGEVRKAGVTNASDINVLVHLRPGELTIEPLLANINGGSVTGSYAMASTSDAGSMALELNARGVKTAASPDAAGDGSGEPPVDLSIAITGSGRTPHAVAASANGSISIDIGSGRSTQGDVGFLANDVLAEMFSAAGPDEEEIPFTDVECGIVRATIEDGKADVDTILIKTSNLVITGSGKIELETESIDIGFNTKAREGLGIAAAGLVTPFVKLGGSLRSPAVAVDAPSALLAGGLAVATGGVSLLGKEVLDRVVSEAADCSPPNTP